MHVEIVACHHATLSIEVKEVVPLAAYLPDLEGYLAALLRSRERLRGAFVADDWATAEAMPSEAEISRIRRLISQIKAEVDDLPATDRAQIEESIGIVRRARTTVVGLGHRRSDNRYPMSGRTGTSEPSPLRYHRERQQPHPQRNGARTSFVLPRTTSRHRTENPRERNLGEVRALLDSGEQTQIRHSDHGRV